MEFVTCFICGLIVLCLAFWYNASGRRLPPGPTNVFGRFFNSSSKETTKYLLSLKKKYGSICCIRILGTPCIYLNTHEKIRECFIGHGDATSARLNFTGIKHRFSAGRGVILNDGLSWQEHRRFALSTLRDFGFGKGGTEQVVQNELTQLITDFEALDGKASDPRMALNMATCNVICSLVFGERCGNEPGFGALYAMLQQNIEGPFTSLHELLLYYTLKIGALLPAKSMPRTLKNFDGICDYLEAKIENHKKTFVDGEVRDLIDAYLKELQTQNDPNGKTSFDNANFLRLILDLFIAGMETTASTLRWGLLFIASNPFIQKRVQAELDEMVPDRFATTADRKQLPYLDAVVMEMQRVATLTPLGGLPHRVTEEFKIDDFVIPKDSLLFANLFAAHRDESIWPDPFHFNPDNFYDEANKSTKNAEFLIPFGVGRRSCLGESLAKQELFVLFAGLLQTFDVKAPTDRPMPTEDDCRFSRLRIAPPYQIVMAKRGSSKQN